MAKIAISLPDDVLRDVEKERQASGETRSQFFRRAVTAMIKHRREKEWDEQYVRAYREMPETREEIEAWSGLGLEALAQDPWDGGEDK